MTQEQKQLLLVDLCARLPYQPICEFTDTEDDFCTATAALGYSLRDFIAGKVLIKPYLRPMSSMTEEERLEYRKAYEKDFTIIENSLDAPIAYRYPDGMVVRDKVIFNEVDWLISNHFDYRGLIPMGLALEAPEEMYKF